MRPTASATSRCGRRAGSAIALLALLALVVAGCGSSSSSSNSSTPATSPPATSPPATTPAAAGGAPTTLALASDPSGQLKYDKTTLTAKPGAVSIQFTNTASISHNVTVESSSGASEGATPTFEGGSKTLSLTLKPGVYKFYCSVPGHRQAGMEGTLTVK